MLTSRDGRIYLAPAAEPAGEEHDAELRPATEEGDEPEAASTALAGVEGAEDGECEP